MNRDERKEPLGERLPEHIFSRIHQDIGAATICWTKIEKAGIFKSNEASDIAFNLCQFIADELERRTV
jgi:hypothetical protein